MFEMKPVVRGVLLACGGIATAMTLVTPAAAQQPQQQPQQLERVEITGSAIRRAQQEGPAPVEIITKKDIERTGATTLNELLRSLPSIDIFDQGELASNSPAGSGTANIAIRGLSSSNLLVLLNGRRLPVNAIYDSSGAGAAVDINTIPLSAVERIEILKDGGSAIYGADAVSGVFNIITKRDYQGIEARAGYGESSRSDGKETSVGLSAGFGDLNKDRFNVLLGFDYYKRDPIYRKDREVSRSVDFSRYGGGDRRSTFSPTGNIVDPNTGAFVFVPYKPCPPELQSNGGTICRYDFNASLLTSYNGADRMSGLGLATFQITPSIKGFFEATYSKTEDHFEAHPVPDFFLVPALNAAQGAFRDVTVPITPANPFGSIFIAGRFMQGGPRITDRESTLLNLVGGFEGTSFGMDWKASYSRGTSEVTNRDQNYYNENLWVPATSNGSIDPTVGTNNAALVESLKVRPVRIGESTIDSFNVQIGGDLFRMPAGPLQYAVGAAYIKEDLIDTPDPLTQAGLVVGSIQQSSVNANRSNKAVFVEFGVPITKTIEAQLAVRYDKYPTASESSPKAAVKWQALSNLLFRGSYTQSFRAPVLKQLFGAQEQGAATVTQNDLCLILIGTAPCVLNVFQVNGSNPNLKPETAETWNFGVVFDLDKFSSSIDFWRINKEGSITSPTFQSAIRQGLYTRVGPQFFVFTNLQNIAESANAGIDVDMKLRLPGTGLLGTVIARNVTTYYTVSATRAPGQDWGDFVGTYAVPVWRNTLVLTSETGPWTGQLALRSVGGFSDNDDPKPHPVGTRQVNSYEELDFQVSYAGFKGLTLTGGIKNLTDRQPPFSLQNAADNRYTQMGFAELYTNRGRFFYGSVTYKFR